MSSNFENILLEARSLSYQYQVLQSGNTSFKERLLLAYNTQFLDKLIPALEQENLTDLQQVLADNWQLMQINCVNYTVMSNHETTKLSCTLAAALSQALTKEEVEINPLELLMPGIETESSSDDYPDLNPTTGEELQDIIATHILGVTGKYLIPVQILANTELEELNNILNPYYNYEHPENYQFGEQDKVGYVTAEEVSRLINHSSETQALKSTWDQCQKLCSDESTLLGQLNHLKVKLTFYDAYQGNGSQSNAGSGAYTALIAFFEYFETISDEQKQNIPSPVRAEINKIFDYLTNISSNANATQTIGTCIADRREALNRSMKGHEDALNQISISQEDKGQFIAQTLKQIEDSQTALSEKVKAKNYIGQDSLPITQGLLDALQIEPSILSHADLRDFLSLRPEEVKNLLINNVILQSFVLYKLQSIDDLIDISHDVKASVFEVLFDVLGENLKYKVNFSDRYLPQLFYAVPNAVFQVICDKWVLIDDTNGYSKYDYILLANFHLPELFLAILECYPAVEKIRYLINLEHGQREQLKAILNSDDYELKLVEAIPAEERLAALKQKDWVGNTILHKLLDLPKALQKVLELLPDDSQRLQAVQIKNCTGTPLLAMAVIRLDTLLVILNALSAQDRYQSIQENVFEHGNTLLHAHISEPESLLKILDLYADDDQRIAAIFKENLYQQTPLYSAKDHPESLKILLGVIPEKQRLTALQTILYKNHETLLHELVQSPELLKEIIETMIPEDQRLEALLTTDALGNTLFYKAVNAPDTLQMLFNLCSDSCQIQQVLQTVNMEGDSLLLKASHSSRSLQIILDLYPDHSQKLEAVQAVNSFGETALHKAVYSLESLQLLLDLYADDEQRYEAVQKFNNSNETALSKASHYYQSFEALLYSIPETQRLTALQTVVNGCQVLVHTLLKSPDLLKNVIETIVPEDQRVDALQTVDSNGNTLLHKAIDERVPLHTILDLYPDDEQRLKAVMSVNNCRDTVLHKVANSPSLIEIILRNIPPNSRFKAVQALNKSNTTVLQLAQYNFQCLKTILAYIPDHQMLEVLEQLIKDNYFLTSDYDYSPFIYYFSRRIQFHTKEEKEQAVDMIMDAIEIKRARKLKHTSRIYLFESYISNIEQYLQDVLATSTYISSERRESLGVFIKALRKLTMLHTVNYYSNKEELKHFQEEFIKILHSQDEFMASHRELWKPILINLMIACTGIGLLAIMFNAIHNSLIKIAKGEKIYTSDVLFFAKTNREMKIKECEDFFNSPLGIEKISSIVY